MKKIIMILVIIGITLPMTVTAMTPGWGSDIDCNVWREGMTTQANYCSGNNDFRKRIYELEVLITELENQNRELANRVNNIAHNIDAKQTIIEKEVIIQEPDNSRVEQLEEKSEQMEQRISALEKALNYIIDKVMSAITTTIDLLKKLL